MEDDDRESIRGEDRMPLLRLSIAGSAARMEMRESHAQASGLDASHLDRYDLSMLMLSVSAH